MSITGSEQQQKHWSRTRAYLIASFSIALVLSLVWVFYSSVSQRNSSARKVSNKADIPQLGRPGLPRQNPPEVAEKAASEVLKQLKSDPDNFDLLRKAGNVYMYSRVFSGAISYYKRALAIHNDSGVRNNYANALFYSGDADAALQQYAEILKSNPSDDNALFNRGMVLWEGKNDPKDAIQSWEKLLKIYPNHPRKAHIEEMIEHASQHTQTVR